MHLTTLNVNEMSKMALNYKIYHLVLYVSMWIRQPVQVQDAPITKSNRSKFQQGFIHENIYQYANLTHRGLVTSYGIWDFSQQWLR